VLSEALSAASRAAFFGAAVASRALRLRREAVRVLAVSGVVAAAACSDAGAPPAAADGAGGRAIDPPVALPPFTLTDQHGEPFELRGDTPGRVTLLFFGYTNCPDICPVHMANLAAVMRDLPLELTRQVDVLFVTTDPDRDTPERLDEWLGQLHPRFVGLWGSREEIAALEAAVGVPGSVVAPDTPSPDGGYFVGHAAQVLAFGPDDVARVAYPWGTRQRDWIRDLPVLVAGGDPLAEATSERGN
jgi:protein SCO1/2